MGEMSFDQMLKLREILTRQKDEIEKDLEEIRELISKEILSKGLICDEHGSRLIELWNADGSVTDCTWRYSDRISFQKKAGEDLENAGFWDIYKEKSLDPQKIKALRDDGQISDSLWDQILKDRGSWSLIIKDRQPTDEEKTKKAEEDKLREEANDVF